MLITSLQGSTSVHSWSIHQVSCLWCQASETIKLHYCIQDEGRTRAINRSFEGITITEIHTDLLDHPEDFYSALLELDMLQCVSKILNVDTKTIFTPQDLFTLSSTGLRFFYESEACYKLMSMPSIDIHAVVHVPAWSRLLEHLSALEAVVANHLHRAWPRLSISNCSAALYFCVAASKFWPII